MSEVDDYISSVAPAEQAEFGRIRRIVYQILPSAEQSTSYGMPAYFYKGKALLSHMANKNFLSIYPFSGKVVAELADQLVGFQITSGSIHFSAEKPLPEDMLTKIIKARMREIEGDRIYSK